MKDEEKVIFVKNYIVNKIAKGYMVGDLNRLLDIKVIPDHDGNANFPIALYTLTCMSFLGYLIADRDLLHDWERINVYIEQMFNPEDKAEIEPHKVEFSNKYRNGLVHEFFPKMGGISRVNNQLMTLSKEGFWVLDADILAKMFKRSVDNFSGATAENSFCIRIYERYKTIQDKNLSLKDKPTTSTTALSSRATTTTLPYDYRKGVGATGPAFFPPSKGVTGVASSNIYDINDPKFNK